jgi:hypothetical protein
MMHVSVVMDESGGIQDMESYLCSIPTHRGLGIGFDFSDQAKIMEHWRQRIKRQFGVEIRVSLDKLPFVIIHRDEGNLGILWYQYSPTLAEVDDACKRYGVIPSAA